MDRRSSERRTERNEPISNGVGQEEYQGRQGEEQTNHSPCQGANNQRESRALRESAADQKISKGAG